MHSYHNKLLPNHFDEYFIPLSSIHYHSTRLATSKNLFLPRVNSSSGKSSLKFIGPKYGLQHQTILNFQPCLPLNGNLRNTSYMKKIPNSQLWTLTNISLVQNKILCILVFCNSAYFLWTFAFSYFLCAHSMLLGIKVHPLFFSVLLFFFCTSLISFCNFFTFFISTIF